MRAVLPESRRERPQMKLQIDRLLRDDDSLERLMAGRLDAYPMLRVGTLE